MPQRMAITGGIKFSLNIVSVFSTYPAPSRHILGIIGCIVTIGHLDSN